MWIGAVVDEVTFLSTVETLVCFSTSGRAMSLQLPLWILGVHWKWWFRELGLRWSLRRYLCEYHNGEGPAAPISLLCLIFI